MRVCRACLLRSLRALTGDGPLAPPAVRPPRRLATPHLPTPPIRRAASTAVARRNADEDDLVPGAQPIPSGGDGRRQRKPSTEAARKGQRALRMELQYLSDPLKLAQHVHYTLRCEQPDKALELCRIASRNQTVTVSWNHCVDWHMARGQVKQAMDIYNEMKKRGQFPDAYTYTLLLRGLAKPLKDGEPVEQSQVVKAVSIYNSMSSPTSRVKPTIYHTNAALNVCAMALDMDAVWSIAAQLPSSGPRAPDHLTYTILLTAIRNGAVAAGPADASEANGVARRQEAVNQGRRIWQEIIPKWRAGEVHLDEQLVCAMGRLLLISPRMRDWDNILDLVQQAMEIDRQIAPVDSAGRQTTHIPQQVAQHPHMVDEDPEDADGYRDVPSTKAFHPVKVLTVDSSSSQSDKTRTIPFVRPGPATLSLILGACTELRTRKAANAYWDLLTDANGPYRLHPDESNFQTLLHLLLLNRASARAVQVLRTMPEHGVQATTKTYRLAMACCTRDKNNHNALDHAWAVIEQMKEFGERVDPQTLRLYLDLAVDTRDGAKIATALKNLESLILALEQRASKTTHQGLRGKSQNEPAFYREFGVTEFFQALVGAIHTLLDRKLIADEELVAWRDTRVRLTRLIGNANGVRHPAQELRHGVEVAQGKHEHRSAQGIATSDLKTTSNIDQALSHSKGEVSKAVERKATRQALQRNNRVPGAEGLKEDVRVGSGGRRRRKPAAVEVRQVGTVRRGKARLYEKKGMGYLKGGGLKP